MSQWWMANQIWLYGDVIKGQQTQRKWGIYPKGNSKLDHYLLLLFCVGEHFPFPFSKKKHSILSQP